MLKAVKTQVKTRLESSLHSRVYIIPDKDKNPSQVEHPWNIDVKSGSKPPSRLPKNTHIIEVFGQEGVEGRLLILGKPGAGKTTMLLELAKALVQRAEQDLSEPVPILLSLSSWQNHQQSIADWIVAELTSGKYYKVRKDIAKQMLQEGEIIPLLDGLDELAAERQESCVQKLNKFLQPGNWIYPLVVCSRIEEYQLYSTKLALNTSLELQPFSDEQIQEYLRLTSNEQLGDSIRDDLALRELAQTPFLLNVIVLSFQKLSLDKWQELKSSEERLDYLFLTYVEVMLERRYEKKRPSDEKTKRWLGCLALKLIEQNKTEFFIEEMQPTWLEDRKHERIYRLILGLISGLFVVPFVRLAVVLSPDALFSGPIGGLFFGLFIGLLVGLLVVELSFGLNTEISEDEFLQINWKFCWSDFGIYWMMIKLFGMYFGVIGGLFVGLRDGLFVGLREGLFVGLREGLFVGLRDGLFAGLIGGLFSVLFFGLLFGLACSEIETRTIPNQVIRESLKNAVISWLISWLISGLFFGRIFGPFVGRIFRLSEDPFFWLISGLFFGLASGLINGGIACIQHFSLRLILYSDGHIPWNYARFLDYATNRLFLQRVGGGYRFMHDLLRQHFAANYR